MCRSQLDSSSEGPESTVVTQDAQRSHEMWNISRYKMKRSTELRPEYDCQQVSRHTALKINKKPADPAQSCPGVSAAKTWLEKQGKQAC